ncbi:thymidine phosphorylase [Flavimaricola marinus]|uniref:Thymidine phosphorylase n=1 Tax=Flavimaricola marinus TaxID=1819565 RepID=A0A238LII6_9RHOB|nr:thymidine phosphorylase [Flavimaricola marinus]SMY08776.1 Thymidine phosphorylase [Flavimaricola marinus]
MDARAIIAGLRRGEVPSAEALQWFAAGLASGAVTDAQAGAFAMAVCLNGLGDEGRVALTRGMRDSGDVLHWSMPGPVLDKHSTGGVGDCVSLLLAPALAACGVYVPMVSGRGLGHTGGTLDKLESIPGLSVSVTEKTLRDVVAKVGCAIVSATGQIAPADKRLYAIRDVTGTVESIDLITASILSKKLAAGLEGLVLDVKSGSGAFMKTDEEAEALARALVETAKGAGCPTAAFVTDMDQPLAPNLGNALEVAVSMEVMSGNRLAAPRLHDLTVALGGRLMALSGAAEGEAEEQIAATLTDGRAMAHFAAMVAAMGGPPDMADDWRTHLPSAPYIVDVKAPDAGHVAAWDGEALGLIVVDLGGGRRVETDKVDPAVGISDVVDIGVKVGPRDVLARVHARTREDAEAAATAVLQTVTIGDKPAIRPLIHARID